MTYRRTAVHITKHIEETEAVMNRYRKHEGLKLGLLNERDRTNE